MLVTEMAKTVTELWNFVTSKFLLQHPSPTSMLTFSSGSRIIRLVLLNQKNQITYITSEMGSSINSRFGSMEQAKDSEQ